MKLSVDELVKELEQAYQIIGRYKIMVAKLEADKRRLMETLCQAIDAETEG